MLTLVCRCIVHYQNQRRENDDKSIYRRLLESSIYISTSIYKSLSIVQYSQTIPAELSPANFHLEEGQGKLGLYIPREEVAREQCYFQQLPRRLMVHFAILDQAAEALLSGIISCKFLGTVDRMLKDAGIIEIDGIERSLEEVQRTYQPDNESVSAGENTLSTTAYQTSESRSVTPQSSVGRVNLFRYEVDYSGSVPRRSPQPDGQASELSIRSHSPQFRLRSPSPLFQNISEPLIDNATPEVVHNSSLDYIAILDRVINSAARLYIPEHGDCSVDNLDTGLHLRDAMFLSALNGRSTERNRKVGAAGELFVGNNMLYKENTLTRFILDI